ncbi:MAG: DNA primase [Peptostreptococcales bacterium]|jgi:DNA primase
MDKITRVDIVEEIKSRSNIVDVISRYLNLKKTGNNYKGLCPFHSENTPSFVVSEEKQIFTCFGCGATGDVIEFVKRIEHKEFTEVIEKLALDSGIEIKSNKSSVTETKKQELYAINREAALFFYNNMHKENSIGHQYIVSRGILPSTIKKFGLGFAEKKWDDLYKHLKEKNIQEKTLLKLGLISLKNEKYYDKFINRIIFPIINTRGKVIGFGGRVIDEGMPKYLNSPESILFQKKFNLYGLNLSKNEIQMQNYVILVEGYLDVISLYNQGIKNVVASLGTALTENQAKMIKRYTDNVVVAYDSDEAGQAAANRGMDILFDAGCKVKILEIKGFKDPDEYIKAKGRKLFIESINNATPFMDYKINTLKKAYDLSNMDQRVEFVNKVAQVLKRTKNYIEIDAYVDKIANETKISKNAIKLEINGNNNTKITPAIKKEKKLNIQTPNDAVERTLIKLVLNNGDFIPKVTDLGDIFLNHIHKDIFKMITILYQEDSEIDLAKLRDSLFEEEYIEILNNIIQHIQFNGKDSIVFEDCVNKIETDRLTKRQNEILEILKLLNEKEDEIKIDALTIELLEIQNKLKK